MARSRPRPSPLELTVADGQIVVATPAAVAEATAVPGAGAPAIKLPAAGLQASEPLTLEGTGTPGSTVTVYDGDEVIATTTVAPDGTWTLTVPPLAPGADSLVAKQVGADGKEQGASAPMELTVADGQIVVATPAAVAGATAVPGAATAAPTLAAGTTVSPTAAAVAGRSDRCGNGSQWSAVNRRHPGRQRADGCDAGRRCRRCGPDHDARGYGRAGSNGQGL